MDNTEMRARFYFFDSGKPNQAQIEGRDYIDMPVSSRGDAIEIANEGVWVKDTFYLIKKMTILPPAKKVKITIVESENQPLSNGPGLS